jgi:hypothetical protein
VRKAMMRLNWLQWIGVVLSIAWFIGGTLWINSRVIDVLGDPATVRFRQCIDARSIQSNATKPNDTNWALCSATFNRDYVRDVSNHWFYAIAYALVPIPIAWLIAWGLLTLIRAGRRDRSSTVPRRRSP